VSNHTVFVYPVWH